MAERRAVNDEQLGNLGNGIGLLSLTGRAVILTWRIHYDKGLRVDSDGEHVGAKPFYEERDTGAANDSEWRIAA